MLRRSARETPQVAPALPLPTWRTLMIVGLASRVVVVVLGLIACRHEASPEGVHTMDAATEGGRFAMPGRIVDSWYRFDAIWYVEVANLGYSYRGNTQASAAFLPLLPWCMRAGSIVGLYPYWTGLIVPNLAFAVGLAAFGRLAARVSGSSATAWKACALLIAYPWSLFFSAPYQESLAFALTALASLCWIERKPGFSALALLPAGLARISSLAVPAGAVAEWAEARWQGRPARRFVATLIASGMFGTAVLMTIMAVRFGDPLANFRAHGGWNRTAPSLLGLEIMASKIVLMARKSPWHAGLTLAFLGWPLIAPDPLASASKARRLFACLLGLIAMAGLMGMSILIRWNFTLLIVAQNQRNLLCMLLMTGLGLRAWRLHGAFWGTMILVPVLQLAATGNALSMPRLGLMAYPAAIVAARLIRRQSTLGVVVGIMAIGQVVMIDRFVNWLFAG